MTKQYDSTPPMTIDPGKSYVATLATNHGDVVVDLNAMAAPITVNNFVFLAKDGFYDGTIFHRVIQNFMIQGGDPQGDGRGGPGYKFRDETDSGLSFKETHLLAMANAGPGTNGSQFFITVAPTPWLDGKHTIFGKVTKGAEIVDSISKLPTQPGDRPTEPVIISSISIDES